MAFCLGINHQALMSKHTCILLLLHAFSMCVCVCAGARQTPVMSVSTRVNPMLWETDGGQTTASYVTVWPTLQCSVPPTVHTLSVDAHR